MLFAALALVLAGCAAPPLERPSFTPTDAGRIAVPVSRDETLTGTLTLPGAGSPALLDQARAAPDMAPQPPNARSAPAKAVALLDHALSTRTAQTLYSGIFEEGSKAALVRKFAADSPSFTNGTKIAPAFTASVTRA